MLTPAKYEIICPQGATLDKTFTAENDGDPVDWTGYTAALQVRQYYGSDTTVLSLSTGSGIAALTSNGQITITATATQTAAIPAGNYVYDLELTSGSYKIRLLEGRFTVTPEVTR